MQVCVALSNFVFQTLIILLFLKVSTGIAKFYKENIPYYVKKVKPRGKDCWYIHYAFS